MRIEIEQFILESNPSQSYDLTEKFFNKKTGKESIRDIGYGYSIPGALKAMTRHVLHKQDTTVDFAGYLKAYEKVVRRLEALAELV